MCGFVALLGDGAQAPERIEAGVRALAHRGPDDDGVWRSPCGRVALGHARLAILDLSPAGAQPMLSHSGRTAIVYNGECYNFRELGKSLGVPLRSGSDTEVILEMLEARGPSAIEALRGMFGLAWWNGEELLVVRDRLGIKPVFLATDGALLGVASEIQALVAMGFGRRGIDAAALEEYPSYLYVPPPRTGILDIEQLEPGHRVRLRPGQPIVRERYWSIPRGAARKPIGAEELNALVDDAVQSHLVSDVPVGVFLSGGLDSSALVAAAAPVYSGRLRTFCITFGREGRGMDERSFANEVAQRYGTLHSEIEVKADVAEILPKLAAHFGQPFGNPTATLSYALCRAARTEVKVALAGRWR
jgi:asparagine synthase (glutamine-hydrolysing)